MMALKNIGIFCGSSMGNNPVYEQTTRQLSRALVEQGIGIVYGGAKVGLMGVLADEAQQQQGTIIGVMPQSLVDVELAAENLTDMHIVNSMAERKNVMAALSDAFIMLPGAAGSLDEFFEMYTLAQLGYQNKPCAIFNVQGYYDHLLNYLQHAVDQGFLSQQHLEMVIVESDMQLLMDKLLTQPVIEITKWGAKTDSLREHTR